VTISACGLRLDNETIRIRIAFGLRLRVGLYLRSLHACPKWRIGNTGPNTA